MAKVIRKIEAAAPVKLKRVAALGAQVGFFEIPAKYTEKLELRDLMIEVVDGL